MVGASALPVAPTTVASGRLVDHARLRADQRALYMTWCRAAAPLPIFGTVTDVVAFRSCARRARVLKRILKPRAHCHWRRLRKKNFLFAHDERRTCSLACLFSFFLSLEPVPRQSTEDEARRERTTRVGRPRGGHEGCSENRRGTAKQGR